MHFSDAEIENSSTPQGRGKVLGVIVLTDNRQDKPPQKKTHSDYTASAFKDTEVDPLEFAIQTSKNSQNQNALVELSIRLRHLEERVEALSKNEVMGGLSSQGDGCGLRKKNRRKFKELQRNHMCKVCEKMYGSDTSLKYHLKLKHPETVNLAQVQ